MVEKESSRSSEIAETTTPLQVAEIDLATTTTTAIISTTTSVTPAAPELDPREETVVDVGEDINIVDIDSANPVNNNNEIKPLHHQDKAKPRFKTHKHNPGRFGSARRNGVNRHRKKESVTGGLHHEKDDVTDRIPLDISQTASNLFLSTFMGSQRTERPIISSTMSRMVVMSRAEVGEKSTSGIND